MSGRAIPCQYRRLSGLDDTLCVYCGEPATERDHVLPVAVARRVVGSARTLTDEERTLLCTVPACHSCNGHASDRYHPSLYERLMFIQQRILAADPKAGYLPWEPEELRKFGRTLRGRLADIQLRSDETRRRLEYNSPILDPEGPCAGVVAAPRALLEPGLLTLETIEKVAQVVALLEDLDVPKTASITAAGKALRAAGYSVRQSHIHLAQRRRRGDRPTAKRPEVDPESEDPQWVADLRAGIRNP